MKKWLWMLVLVVALLPCTALAKVGDAFVIDGMRFQVLTERGADGTVALKNASSDANCEIPAQVECSGITYVVKEIADKAFFNCQTLETVTIPYSVISIGEMAFMHCVNLESVAIPMAMENIGSMAFAGCTSLRSVTFDTFGLLPLTIGSSAFAGCTSLQSVTLPHNMKSLGSSAFSGCTDLNTVHLYHISAIADYTFSDCSSLMSIHLSDVTAIGAGAFERCTQLSSLNIPSSLTSIGKRAFAGCTGLKDVLMMEDAAKDIAADAFDGCTATITRKLVKPTGLARSGMTVSWNPIGAAESYEVQLYKGGFDDAHKVGKPISTKNAQLDLSPYVADVKDYGLTVVAKATGRTPSDAAQSMMIAMTVVNHAAPPKTGDQSQPLLWSALMLLSAAAAATLMRQKKENA